VHVIPADILRALTLSKHLGSITLGASRFNLRTCKFKLFSGGCHLWHIRIGWVSYVGGLNLLLQD